MAFRQSRVIKEVVNSGTKSLSNHSHPPPNPPTPLNQLNTVPPSSNTMVTLDHNISNHLRTCNSKESVPQTPPNPPSLHLRALILALPAIGDNITKGLAKASPLRVIFNKTLPAMIIASISDAFSHFSLQLRLSQDQFHRAMKVEEIMRRVIPYKTRRSMKRIAKKIGKGHRNGQNNGQNGQNGHKNVLYNQPSRSLLTSHTSQLNHHPKSSRYSQRGEVGNPFGATNGGKRDFFSNFARNAKNDTKVSLSPPKHNTSPNISSSFQQNTRRGYGGKTISLQRTIQRQYSTKKSMINTKKSLSLSPHSLSYLKPFLPIPSSLLTIPKRNFQFKRFKETTRWSFLKFYGDLFSPVRTLYNWLRRGKWYLRRFLPGRFAGYLAFIMTGVCYTWVIMLLLERNRQFDSGWTNPELSNFGYFLKRDWAYSNASYDVEIYRKRKRYQKMDGNRFLHEEDLKIERIRPKRWSWMFGDNIDRYGKARGIWPLRSYVINSPQYVDRKYLSRGYNHRRDKFGKWVKAFGDHRNSKRHKKRALRLRGGKYEYGGTAHQYYFTKTHDTDRYMRVPTTQIPKAARRLHDAGKY